MRDLKQVRGPMVVCAPLTLPAFYTDDLEGVCLVCGEGVRHRPHIPVNSVLVCLLCYLVRAEPGDGCLLLGEARIELEALGWDVPKC